MFEKIENKWIFFINFLEFSITMERQLVEKQPVGIRICIRD